MPAAAVESQVARVDHALVTGDAWQRASVHLQGWCRSANNVFDCLVDVEARLQARHRSAFSLSGGAGLGFAFALAAVLAELRGLSLLVVALLWALSFGAFLLVSVIEALIAGGRRLVCFHAEAFVFAAAAAFLAIGHQPVMPYLDLCALGVGTFLIFGRIGCLLAGCCHGRPWVWGIRYGEDLVDKGLPPEYAGLRLFPVQLAESVILFGIVVVGTGAFIMRAAPGLVFSWYLLGHAAARYFLEYARGDVERPFAWGISEAQWTSVGVVSSLAALSLRGGMSILTPFAVATASVMLGAVCMHARRRGTSAVMGPAHLCELAGAIRATDGAPGQLAVMRTRLGCCVSGSRTPAGGALISHYAFSHQPEGLWPGSRFWLRRLVMAATPGATPGELLSATSSNGIFHVVVRSPGEPLM